MVGLDVWRRRPRYYYSVTCVRNHKGTSDISCLILCQGRTLQTAARYKNLGLVKLFLDSRECQYRAGHYFALGSVIDV